MLFTTLGHLFEIFIYCFTFSPAVLFFTCHLTFTISFWRLFGPTYFNKCPPASPLMLPEPFICWLRLTIHCSLDITVEWWSCLAGSVAAPNMLSIKSNLIIKVMIDSNVESGLDVDRRHYLFKLVSVSAFSEASSWVG